MSSDDPDRRIRNTLERYADDLLRATTQRLLKPRNRWPIDELIRRNLEALINAPVLDRRLGELPEVPRKALALMGVTRQPRWRVGRLIEALATLGHTEGLTPILTLLEWGLLFPEIPNEIRSLRDFTEALSPDGMQHTWVFTHPFVAQRAIIDTWGLGEDRGRKTEGGQDHSVLGLPSSVLPLSDGLDWPLRLALVWQQTVAGGPMRLTQGGALFKREWSRIQSHEVLNTPLAETIAEVPDKGLLALGLAQAVGLLDEHDLELHAKPFPLAWDEGLYPALTSLWSALPQIDDWDPLDGWRPGSELPLPFPSLVPVLFLLLAALPEDEWTTPEALADWAWERHPSWAATLKGDADRATEWVRTLMLGLGFPLRLIEISSGDEGLIRLSELGRSLLQQRPLPANPPEFPKTLTVQPNGEIVAYRQGLTPALIAQLSHFAVWKSIGPACTLELTPEQVYLGLERGCGLKDVLQILHRHGMRETPGPVEDLLRRWAGKRERITLYTSATLMEFATPGDLNEAMSRGLVEMRITDRIGLVSGGAAIDWTHFRQTGNRDYEAPPLQCAAFEDDGVTFLVDTTKSDLLLEAELSRLAEPINVESFERRYRLTPQSLRRARDSGVTLLALEQWCRDRSGEELSPAARLIYPSGDVIAATATAEWVVWLPSESLTDGVVQWPTTGQWVIRRLGPTAFSVAEDALQPLGELLARLGIELRIERG